MAMPNEGAADDAASVLGASVLGADPKPPPKPPPDAGAPKPAVDDGAPKPPVADPKPGAVPDPNPPPKEGAAEAGVVEALGAPNGPEAAKPPPKPGVEEGDGAAPNPKVGFLEASPSLAGEVVSSLAAGAPNEAAAVEDEVEEEAAPDPEPNMPPVEAGEAPNSPPGLAADGAGAGKAPKAGVGVWGRGE